MRSSIRCSTGEHATGGVPGHAPVPTIAATAPMHITVKLFATLRRGRFDREILDCPGSTKVLDIVTRLAIPEKQAAIIFINSRHGGLDTELHEGDTLALFPPVGGG